MLKILIIGGGGFVGAVCRYGLSSLVQRHVTTFPAATLAVNTLGCLAIGALMALAAGRTDLSAHVRSFLTIGLLGSFTTFSTMGLESFDLIRGGEIPKALFYILLSVTLGIGAVALGWSAIRTFAG
ncbi:MAG: fluoride efflux transporter CrcB [Phycisphaeraceae bacterium]|nr:fluoride efflux transporter CrcB [Phycisphaeraceae bacterium]